MKNGSQKRLILIFVILLFTLAGTCFTISNAWGGNKEHVEKRVEELNNLNEQIINQLIKIPKSGSIEFKATVIDNEKTGPNIIILEKKIVLTSPGKKKIKTSPDTLK